MAELPARLLTLKEAAGYVRLSVTSFERRVRDGQLPKAIKLGGCARWDRAHIDRILNTYSGLKDDAPTERLGGWGDDLEASLRGS